MWEYSQYSITEPLKCAWPLTQNPLRGIYPNHRGVCKSLYLQGYNCLRKWKNGKLPKCLSSRGLDKYNYVMAYYIVIYGNVRKNFMTRETIYKTKMFIIILPK